MKKIKETMTRTHRPVKVIQFGEGNFLRAFVDWMIYETNQKTDFNGGIAVVQPLAQGLCQMLEDQDCLYTHYMNGMVDGKAFASNYINDSIEYTVNPYEDYKRFLELADIETARFIVSNTTEAGIAYDPEDKLEGPQKSFPGKLTALLYRRFQNIHNYHGDSPQEYSEKSGGFILLPCELIDYNGDKLKEVVLKYANLWDLGETFIRWVNEANTFCNTLVDRIVPGYPRERIEEVTEELGYKDNLVVESEVFNLWVIEGPESIRDEFPVHKTDCNALFVEDVTPYKTRKVRILNGAHTTLVPIGYLYGIDTVRESVEDPVVSRLLNKAMYEEIIPTLSLGKEELELFASDVMDRFRNPFIKHYLLSISLNSMSKYRTRVLPSLLGYLEANGELPEILTLALGAYVVFYKGQRGEAAIDLKDDQDILDLYTELWKDFDGSEAAVEKVVKGVLGYEKNWGTDLNDVPHLTAKVKDWVVQINAKGMTSLVQEVMG